MNKIDNIYLYNILVNNDNKLNNKVSSNNSKIKNNNANIQIKKSKHSITSKSSQRNFDSFTRVNNTSNFYLILKFI